MSMSNEERRIESGRDGAGTLTSSRLPSRPSVPDGFKRCSACGEVKPKADFNKRKDRPVGVQPKCRQCQNARKRSYRKSKPLTPEQRQRATENHARWRAKNREKIREQHRRRKASPRYALVQERARRTMIAKYRERRDTIAEAKRAAGCLFCTETEPCALDVHHVNPKEKEFPVGNDFSTKPWPRILAEAAKCVVLCANCHRKLHDGLLTLPHDAPRLVLPAIDPPIANHGDGRKRPRAKWTTA